MGAIDYFNNVIRVTAAGSVSSIKSININDIAIWSADTTASLIVGYASTGGFELLRFSTNVNVPYTTIFGLKGAYGDLSFNTVTACTAYLFLV